MSRRRSFILSLLLSIPVVLFLLHHYFYHAPELDPTGFTVDENVLYMSYAREYIDEEGAQIFYANPFDGNPESPRIYFQPVNFLFAGAMKSGLDPGFTFSMFGLIMVICCIYIGVRIINFLCPPGSDKSLVAVLFTWGGGLTALAGLIGSMVLANAGEGSRGLDGIYLADPANGWWGLNWGRNLFIPLEAYYHFLFLLSIYMVLKKKWMWAAALALFLTLSHPFTGIEFLLILLGWLGLEKFFYRNRDIPTWFPVSIVLITLFHTWYYLVYLPGFPEHKQLFNQYSAGWTYSLLIAGAAYSLVLILSLLNSYLARKKKITVIPSYQRLFLCWAIIAFLLSKHEWFIRPMQPIHFTRGYTWSGLFLFSIPAIIWLIRWCKQFSYRKWWLIAGTAFLLLDNSLWLFNIIREKVKVEWEGLISDDTRATLRFIKETADNKTLLVGNSRLVKYLSAAYTPATPWTSHPYNTPLIEERSKMESDYLRNGQALDQWNGLNIMIIMDKKTPADTAGRGKWNKIFENESYIIYRP